MCTVTIVTKMRFTPLPQWFLGLGLLFQYLRHVRSARAFDAKGARAKADSCDFDHSTWAVAPLISSPSQSGNALE
jgi:hypothetical protein